MAEITLNLPLDVVHGLSRLADQALVTKEIDIELLAMKMYPGDLDGVSKVRSILNGLQEQASPALARFSNN